MTMRISVNMTSALCIITLAFGHLNSTMIAHDYIYILGAKHLFRIQSRPNSVNSDAGTGLTCSDNTGQITRTGLQR